MEQFGLKPIIVINISNLDKKSPKKLNLGTMPSKEYIIAKEAANYIASLLPEDVPRPEIGIICGSGLSGLISTSYATPQISIQYADIPNFPVPTIPEHQTRLVFGTLGETRKGIVAMASRLHFYDGHDMTQITLPIRVFYLLGVKTLIGGNCHGKY